MMTGYIIPYQNLTHIVDSAFYIRENADMNNYRIAGNYSIPLNSTAKTIANIPVPMAGRLIVVNATGTDVELVPGVSRYGNWLQWYITIQGDIYVRTMGSDGNGQLIFGKWKKFASPEVIV